MIELSADDDLGRDLAAFRRARARLDGVLRRGAD